MTIRSGALRHSVRIEKRNPHQDGGGGQSGEWIVVAEGVAASIEPWKGKEMFNAGQVQSETMYRCIIRYRAGIDAAMRIVYRGEMYGIIYIEEPGLKREHLQLTLNKGKNQG